MGATVAVVEVPGRAARRGTSESQLCDIANARFGRMSLLQWVVRRVTEAQSLSSTIVLVESQAGRRLDVPADVQLVTSSAADPLARFAEALDSCQASCAVRVRIDNPFVDPDLIDQLVGAAADLAPCDYVGYCTRNGRAVDVEQLGVVAEWFRAGAVRQAAREAREPAERTSVSRYILAHPEEYAIELIPIPAALDRDNVGLSYRSGEVWEHAEELYEAMGPEAVNWRSLTQLLAD